LCGVDAGAGAGRLELRIRSFVGAAPIPEQCRRAQNRHAFDPEAIGPADLDRCRPRPLHRCFATAMRAGFELYRASDQDAADDRAALARAGRLRVPVLAHGGEGSVNFSTAAEMLITVVGIPRSGHWVARESPTTFIELLLRFIDQP